MSSPGETELAKELGVFSALAIGTGTMIGAGIFVLPATAVGVAGPAASLAFVVAGVIALLTALSISELGTAMPKAGGGYYYINDALGPLFGSIAGWGNWLGLAFATAFYMLGFGDYASIYLTIPEFLFLDGSQIAALLAGMLFIGINYYGAKETGRAQILIVVILLFVLLIFTAVGLSNVELDNLRPFFPEDKGGATTVLPAAGLIFVTYLGFAEINTVAEEMKNPGRNLPIAVIGSLVFVIFLYALVMSVVVGIDGPATVEGFEEQAVARLGEIILGGTGLALLTFGGLLATASSANASILASSRINFAMGRDKIITDWINQIHPRFFTPYRSIVITGAIILVFIVWGSVENLAKAGSILHLIVYGLLNIALIVYRETEYPGYDPDFKVPLYPFVPAFGAILSFALIFAMAPIEIILSAIFVVFGGIWYLLYAKKHADGVGLVGEAIAPNGDDAETEQAYRVVVPISNPDTQQRLLRLAAASAQTHTEVDIPELVAVNVIEVPQQTSLEQKLHFEEERIQRQQDLLESAREAAEGLNVSLRTRAIIGRNSGRVLLSVIEEENADMVIMGWKAIKLRREVVFGTTVDLVLRDAPCDVALVHLEKDHIGNPVALAGGGPHAPTAARMAGDFATIENVLPVLLNVQSPNPEDEADNVIERGLHQIGVVADKAGLGESQYEAEVRVSSDIERTILEEVAKYETVCVGVSERGTLSQMMLGTIAKRIAQLGDRNVVLVRSRIDSPKSIRQAIIERLT